METLLSKYNFRIYSVARTELDSSWDSERFGNSWRYTNFTRLYFPIEGEGTITYRDKVYQLKRGKMYLIFPAALAQIKCETRLVKYWIHFNLLNTTTGMDFFMLQREVMEIPVPEGKFAIFCEYFETLCKIYNGRPSAERSVIDEQEASSVLTLLLIPFFHKMVPHQEETDFFRIMELCRYMNQNLSRKITVRELSKLIDVHPNYLSHLFRRHTGMSPIAYLASMRVQYAMAALSEGKLRISEIAERAGANSPQAFSRKFTTIVGFSPREYRKRIQSGTTEFYRTKEET